MPAELGITLRFEGRQVDEAFTLHSTEGNKGPALKSSQVMVKVDRRYLRPTEVGMLLGDFNKAKQKLGRVPL